MGNLLTEIRRMRQTADELVSAAPSISNPAARDTLLEMAEGYGQLANRLRDLAVKRREHLRMVFDAG
jgi:hypothetical protein